MEIRMPKTNQVWIELEKPRDAAHAQEICGQANNLLKRLNPEGKNKFDWSPKQAAYMYGGMDDGGSYTYLEERGKWLNLAFLGRPLDQTPEQWQTAADTAAKPAKKARDTSSSPTP